MAQSISLRNPFTTPIKEASLEIVQRATVSHGASLQVCQNE